MKYVVIALMMIGSTVAVAEGKGKYGDAQRIKRFGKQAPLKDGVVTICDQDKGRPQHCRTVYVKYVDACTAEKWGNHPIKGSDRQCRP